MFYAYMLHLILFFLLFLFIFQGRPFQNSKPKFENIPPLQNDDKKVRLKEKSSKTNKEEA